VAASTERTTLARMSLRSIVFDLDGTLVDSAPDILESLRLALVEAGARSDRPLTRALIGPPVGEMLKAWGEHLTEGQLAATLTAFRRIYDGSRLEHTLPYPGVLESLFAVSRAGMTLFVATNKPLRATRWILENRFPGLFADVCCVDSGPSQSLSKTEMLQTLSLRHHLVPSETVIVGDGESDLLGGVELGWHTMAALYGYGDPCRLTAHRPTWTVASAAEIAPRLLGT